MRFFFEFVSCCGLPTQRSPEPAVPAEEEDESSLVPATPPTAVTSRALCRKKVRMGAAEWRPSLGSISENATPPRETRKGAAASGGRDAKKRSGGGSPKVQFRSYIDGYYASGPSMPTMMPTFSPTPFMF
ncbi:hypothetical protein VNO78_06296 [Psophocarpus tetragonolobus]|uniref:Uncharacterized protein n=1 Tax=Psophocarpus tetragonolobus TaxID=3891 RepID=A0AAN9SS85_PSOTE